MKTELKWLTEQLGLARDFDVVVGISRTLHRTANANAPFIPPASRQPTIG